MTARRSPPVPEIVPKVFANTDEIDRAIAKLQRRINEIEQIDFVAVERDHTGADDAARSNLRNTVLEIYGLHSPEYREHHHIDFWAGPHYVYIPDREILRAKLGGRTQTTGIINGRIARL